MTFKKFVPAAILLSVCGFAFAADETEELKLTLPKPAYEGTPKPLTKMDIEVEKPTGKPRAAIQVPKGTSNLALKKKVTGSDDSPIIGEYSTVTDGDKEGTEASWVELASGLQWIQIDLEKSSDISAILIWHYHRDPRLFRAVVVQVSDDKDFIKGVTTVFNNDQKNDSGLGVGKDLGYFESFEGKLIPTKDVKARYVRLYSKGNNVDDNNQYTEVEVYGKQ
jgi:hypothetical protein